MCSKKVDNWCTHIRQQMYMKAGLDMYYEVMMEMLDECHMICVERGVCWLFIWLDAYPTSWPKICYDTCLMLSLHICLDVGLDSFQHFAQQTFHSFAPSSLRFQLLTFVRRLRFYFSPWRPSFKWIMGTGSCLSFITLRMSSQIICILCQSRVVCDVIDIDSGNKIRLTPYADKIW